MPPDPLKNADAVFDGHVFEIKQTTPNNMVRNINKAAQQARRVVVRLTTGGKNQNYRIRERATAAKRDNRLDELIVIFPDGEVEKILKNTSLRRGSLGWPCPQAGLAVQRLP